MGHHKHKISELPDDTDLETSQTSSTELPLISPNRFSRELGSRKNGSNGAASSSARHDVMCCCAATVNVLPCGCRSGTQTHHMLRQGLYLKSVKIEWIFVGACLTVLCFICAVRRASFQQDKVSLACAG